MLNFLPSPPRPSPGSRFQRSPPSPRSAGRGKTPHARRRGAASNRVRHSYSLVKQHMVPPAFADASAGRSVIRHSLGDGGSFPRRVFAPGFCFLGFAHPNEGWRSAEITLGCSGTRGACLNAARQTPCEASCVSRETLASRRSTVAILGSGPALPSPAFAPDPCSEFLAARS